MSIVRAILIAFIALSVAMPQVAMPTVAEAKAHVHSPDGSSVAAQSDCCLQMGQCDKHAKDDCAKFAECALKCSSLSAAILTTSGIALSPSPSPKATLLTGNASSRSPNPPSPPPRV